jgi:hypothetical protein
MAPVLRPRGTHYSPCATTAQENICTELLFFGCYRLFLCINIFSIYSILYDMCVLYVSVRPP